MEDKLSAVCNEISFVVGSCEDMSGHKYQNEQKWGEIIGICSCDSEALKNGNGRNNTLHLEPGPDFGASNKNCDIYFLSVTIWLLCI